MLLKRGIISLFSIVFGICFFGVFLLCFTFPMLIKIYNHIDRVSIALFLFSFIVVIFYIAVYHFLSNKKAFWLNHITFGLFVIAVLIEIWIITMFKTILPPKIDGGHTYAEALYLLAHGHSSGNIYLKVYPNNIPITVLRYLLYRICSIVHIKNYLTIERIICAILLNVSIYFSWKIVKNYFDKKMGIIFLLMNLTCFPLFVYILYFYTDTMAIIFPVLLLYLWLIYQRSMKIRYILLLGLFLGIGCQIRQNLILFLPALAIYMSFVLRWKKTVANLLIIIVAFFSIHFIAQTYYIHLGYNQSNKFKMPTTHWIMMGLSKDGGYSTKDYLITRSQPSQQAKIQENINQIKQRIYEKKNDGLAYLWGVKMARTWADGTRGYYWYTYISTQRPLIYEYLFDHQKQLILFVIQIFHIVNIFFLLISTLHFFRTKKVNLNLFIQICLFGNFVFYVFLWEAEPRYTLLFTPYMFLGAVFGLNEMIKILARIRNEQPKLKKGKKWSPQIFFPISLIIIVIVCALLNYQEYAKNRMDYKQYSVNQFYNTGGASVPVNKNSMIEQTFNPQYAFNHILLGVKSINGNGIYEISISKLGSNKVLYKKSINSSQVEPRHYLAIVTRKNIPSSYRHYKISVKQISGTHHSSINLSLNGRGYEWRDLYKGGVIIQNNKELSKADLQFKVYSLVKKPYLSAKLYVCLFSVPIFILIFYIYNVLRYRSTKVKRVLT